MYRDVTNDKELRSQGLPALSGAYTYPGRQCHACRSAAPRTASVGRAVVLGLPHPLAHVSLYYRCCRHGGTYLFDRTTESLWGECETHHGGRAGEDLSETYIAAALPKSRSCLSSIQITYKSARKLAHLNLKQHLPRHFVELFNQAVLHLLWTRPMRLRRASSSPYIQLSRVCQSSGLATLTDKDFWSGHKTRLVWMPPELSSTCNRPKTASGNCGQGTASSGTQIVRHCSFD